MFIMRVKVDPTSQCRGQLGNECMATTPDKILEYFHSESALSLRAMNMQELYLHQGLIFQNYAEWFWR